VIFCAKAKNSPNYNMSPIHLRDYQSSPQHPLQSYGQAVRRRPSTEGTQLSIRPVARPTTKQPMAMSSRSSL